MKLVKPKKFLGQHFLKDLKVAQDIADTVDTFPELPILEAQCRIKEKSYKQILFSL